MFVTIALIIGFVYLCYIYLTWTYTYWTDRNVPGPQPKFLVGNFPGQFTQKEHLFQEVQKLYDEYKNKHSFIGAFTMRRPELIVFSPEIVKEVMIKSFKNFHDNSIGDSVDKESDPLFGRNPFLLKGEEWKEKRAEVTPGFTSSRMKAMYPLMEEVGSRLVDYLKRTGNPKDGLDARELAAKFTTDIVSLCVYGLDAKSFTTEKPEIREAGRRMLTFSPKVIFLTLIHAIFPITMKLFRIRFISEDIEHFFIDLMKQSLRYREENNITRIDYMDHLIQLKKKKNVSELELAAHTVTFFLDGFETSGGAIAHTLYLLASHPKVQDKLREEIEETYSAKGRIDFDTLIDMPYLDQVFHESLRILPPVSTGNRKCTEAIELVTEKDKKILIDVDTTVIIPIYGIHHDPEHYTDPEKFDPERFSPENGGVKAYREKGVYLSFGDGPRACLGMRFALCMSKTGLAEIIRNFKVTVNPKTQTPIIMSPTEFLLIPRDGYWLNFIPVSE